jgi:hypothetical protein
LFAFLLKYLGVFIGTCIHLVPDLYSPHYMTEYGVSHCGQLSRDSYDVQERKAARKKLLDEIWQRRRENYKQFLEKKRRLRESGEVV